jgi:WhiB family redox-sensing transcriptional regulator
MTPAAVAELLAALARSVPPLPGALCRGNGELWDPHDREAETPEDYHYRRDAAVRTCRRCPARAACEDWLDSLPAADRPLGIVAGRVIRRSRLAVAG